MLDVTYIVIMRKIRKIQLIKYITFVLLSGLSWFKFGVWSNIFSVLGVSISLIAQWSTVSISYCYQYAHLKNKVESWSMMLKNVHCTLKKSDFLGPPCNTEIQRVFLQLYQRNTNQCLLLKAYPVLRHVNQFRWYCGNTYYLQGLILKSCELIIAASFIQKLLVIPTIFQVRS